MQALAVSNYRTMLLNIVRARNDADRVSSISSTVIEGGSLADGTPIVFNSASLDTMDRVFGAYLTQLMPYMASPPADSAAALSRSYLRRSPVVGLSRDGFLRLRAIPPGKHRTISQQPVRPLPGSPFGSVKTFLGWLNTATNLSRAAVTYQAWAASGTAPAGMEPDRNLLDSVSALAGGMSGMLGFYSQTAGGPTAIPEAAASALLGAISGEASLLNDFGHELGAFALVLQAGEDTRPALLTEAWKEIDDKGTHAGIDAVQKELSLFTFGVNPEGSSLHSAAMNTFGANFARRMQQSAQSETGSLSGGLQAAGLWASYQASLLDGGMQSLYNIDAAIESEANTGLVSLEKAFGEVVGSLDTAYPSAELRQLSRVNLTSDDLAEEFSSMAGPDGSYIIYVPVGDSRFDYANAHLAAVDPFSGSTQIRSGNLDLSNMKSEAPSQAGPTSGTCGDHAEDADDDDPDCDKLGWLRRPHFPRFGASSQSPEQISC